MVRAPGIDLGGLGFNSLSGHITFNILPILLMTLPSLRQIQHTYLTHLLADDIYKRFSAYIPSLEH